ncbi:unnamed protein product [Nyctereutes procyonoides]|uniref:(raccoon dog) hypothetical protein n=1 Tax=Nyctereutes procyonoides TaxID=34880 RepID=A0A811ZEP1_NYCPR|nr:unnamed protein product [Nyctereutes procyonoides]
MAMNISGNFYRNKLKYLVFLSKCMNTIWARGPHHIFRPGHPDHLGVLDRTLPPSDKKKQLVPVYLGCPAHNIGWEYQEVTATSEKKREKRQPEKNMEKERDQYTETFNTPESPV